MVWFSLSVAARSVSLLALTSAAAFAQYYEEPPRSYTPLESRFISVGFFARDFKPRPANTVPDSLSITYHRVMPLLGFRQGPVEALVGYTTYDLRGKRAAVFAGLTYTGEYILAGRRDHALILPMIVAADFTKSEAGGSSVDDFNVGSLGIGTGLKYRIISPSVDFSVMAAGVIHYSFEGYNVQSGSSPAVLGEALVVLPEFPLFDGIVAGYRFRYQTWTLGGGVFDYRTVNHGVFLGVLF